MVSQGSHIDVEAPNCEIGQTAIPTTLTAVVDYDIRIYEMEVVNITSGDITLTCYDCQDSAMLIIPPTILRAGSLLTYTRRLGRLCSGGLAWQASAPGLLGNIQAQKV